MFDEAENDDEYLLHCENASIILRLHRLLAAHTYNEGFRRLGAHPRLIGPVVQILGEDVYVHQFKINAKAPFDGEVAQTFVETGEFVGAGSPVVRLLGVGPQDASFAVAPEDAAAVEALGTVDLLTGSGAVRATITRLERLAEQARLVTVLAQIDPDAPRLPSGTLAEVRYTVALGSGLIVPSGALAADAGRSYVYVVAEERAGTIARRLEVRVVAEAANLAVIEPVQAGALAEGALVIAPRPLDVRDGTAVRVIGE